MNTHRHDNEDGFTLVELLVGMAMALIITAAAVTMFTSVMHRQPEATAAANVIGTARNAVETMTGDLREGVSATVSEPSSLQLVKPCGEENCTISYRCEVELGKSTSRCTRTLEGATKTIASGLASDEVFCVYPTASVGKECGIEGTETPRYVGITLEFPNHKEATGTTILEDGAALHNAPEALSGR
jgi:prepilin-type N-terminal cleavage/methylation domain-containing protein